MAELAVLGEILTSIVRAVYARMIFELLKTPRKTTKQQCDFILQNMRRAQPEKVRAGIETNWRAATIFIHLIF